jgi:hypothetical protein
VICFFPFDFKKRTLLYTKHARTVVNRISLAGGVWGEKGVGEIVDE